MKLKVSDTLVLYNILAECQVNKIQTEELKDKLINNAIALLAEVKNFEAARDKVSKDQKEGDLMQKALEELLSKEVEIDYKPFEIDELKEISKSVQNWTIGMFGVLSSTK